MRALFVLLAVPSFALVLFATPKNSPRATETHRTAVQETVTVTCPDRAGLASIGIPTLMFPGPSQAELTDGWGSGLTYTDVGNRRVTPLQYPGNPIDATAFPFIAAYWGSNGKLGCNYGPQLIEIDKDFSDRECRANSEFSNGSCTAGVNECKLECAR